MSSTTLNKVSSDLRYDEYQERQRFAVTPENIQKQAAALKSSDKFFVSEHNWEIKPYKGFAVVSMVQNNPDNAELVRYLNNTAKLLNEQLNEKTAYYLLPENSYHQTVANTLSDHRYEDNIIKKGKENRYPEMIREAFDSISLNKHKQPLQMKMTGINVFGSCIAILGAFSREEDYNTIVGFRNQFYKSENLNKVDVKWTRPFIGHITLAYLGRSIDVAEQKLLAHTINEINKSLADSDIIFNIAKTELRSYNDLSNFQNKPEYPEYKFKK